MLSWAKLDDSSAALPANLELVTSQTHALGSRQKFIAHHFEVESMCATPNYIMRRL